LIPVRDGFDVKFAAASFVLDGNSVASDFRPRAVERIGA
jgi:hypothetical protein